MNKCHIIRFPRKEAVTDKELRDDIKNKDSGDLTECLPSPISFSDPAHYPSFDSSDSENIAGFDIDSYVRMLTANDSIIDNDTNHPNCDGNFIVNEDSRSAFTADHEEYSEYCEQSSLEDSDDDECEDVFKIPEQSGPAFVCGVCKCSLESLEELVPHMAYHAGPQLVENDVHETFSTTNELLITDKTIIARDSIISAGKRFGCEICSSWFSKTEHLSEHMAAVHFMDEAIKCKFCSKSFTDEKSLKQHMTVHSFTCDVCDKRFPNQYSLEMHLLLHTQKKPRNLCRKTFPKKSSEMQEVCVPKKVDYSCGVCGKRYINLGNLKRHLKIHSSEKSFECTLCPQRFTMKNNLKAHIKLHSGQRPYKCKICKKRFTLKANLQRHILSHTGEKPYACTKCSKRFAEKSTLRKHQTFHTGEKAYPCPICQKNLTELGSLKRHINMHKGKMPYKCIVCSKAFVYSISLKNHMIIHTGEKPFECEVCGKHFTYKGNLKQHKVNIHLGINHRVYKSASKEERRRTLEEAEGNLAY